MRLRNLLVGLLALTWFSAALGQDAYLRLRCEGEAENADVFINGKLKGQCPIDLSVAEGSIQLKVVKNIDQGHYRLFTSELFLSGGAMKRLDVELDAEILFTAQGREQENQRLAALQVAAEAKAARFAAAEEAARVQAEKDAPRLAAEREAARVKAAQQALIAQEAARQAAPGAVQGYMNSMSSKGPDDTFSSATIATTYAPLILPSLTMDDMSAGKSIAMTDPTAFGKPDSMIAKVMQRQNDRETQVPLALAQR
jgi:hypothetical protein